MVCLQVKKDWVQFEVITETGLHLGWVRSASFNAEDNTLISLVIVPSSIGWLAEKLAGAYKLASVDLVYVGSQQLIVAEGSEKRLEQLEVGVLERLGISQPRWMKQEEESYLLLAASRGRNDDTGFQPAIKPQKPSPKPTDDAIEIPLE